MCQSLEALKNTQAGCLSALVSLAKYRPRHANRLVSQKTHQHVLCACVKFQEKKIDWGGGVLTGHGGSGTFRKEVKTNRYRAFLGGRQTQKHTFTQQSCTVNSSAIVELLHYRRYTLCALLLFLPVLGA